MKRLIYLILIIFMAGLVSCEKDGEPIKNAYFLLRTSFIYPTDAVKDYVFLFNRDTLETAHINCYDAFGVLDVIKKGETESEYSQELALTGDTTLQFIKLPGQAVDLYSADNYIVINNDIIYSGTGEGYSVQFNGQELTPGLNYYKRASGLPAQLKIYKDGNEMPIYSNEFNVDENNEIQLTLLQIGETTFLYVTEDTEPDPESQQQTKVRFFYNPSAFPEVGKIKFVIYNWLNFDNPLYELELDPGELSDYITVDWLSLEGGGLCQDIIDVETGIKLVDSYANENAYIVIEQGQLYKKATMEIKGDAIYINVINSLSIKW